MQAQNIAFRLGMPMSIVLVLKIAKADAPRAGASLWGGAVLVSAGVIAFATSPPATKERRPSRKAHVSDPIPEEEA